MIAARFAGRTALITGGTRGIGRAIAERLLAEGAHVVVTGTCVAGTAPQGCDYRAVDFTDRGATLAFADAVEAMAPDVLVNNAGINKISPFAEIDLADFERIQQVNLTAPMLLARAALKPMLARKWGRIVSVSSIWGKISKAHRASYSASKFGLDGMMLALAAEVAIGNVLVNCVAPGFIDTELTRRVLGPEQMATLAAQVPAGRLGRVEEVAGLVAWLASPENTYVTGQNIAIDGGFTRV